MQPLKPPAPPTVPPLEVLKQLGAKLRLDVGPPNEKVETPVGRQEARDSLGMKLDPKLYARKTCGSCRGEGVLCVRVPVSDKMVAALMARNPDNAALIEKEVKRKGGTIVARHNYVREYRTCGCVPRRYESQRKKLIAAIEEHLASSPKSAESPTP